jgi:hypothetical protein
VIHKKICDIFLGKFTKIIKVKVTLYTIWKDRKVEDVNCQLQAPATLSPVTQLRASMQYAAR